MLTLYVRNIDGVKMATVSAAGATVVRLSDCFSGLVDRHSHRVGEFTEEKSYKEAWEATKCSTSAAIMLGNWQKISRSKASLKGHVRAGVSPAVRRQLWLLVSEVSDDDSVLFAKAFGEPADDEIETQPLQIKIMYDWPFELSCLPTFHLKTSFDSAFLRVLTALSYSSPHITTCPLLPVMVHTCLHFLEEWECYAVMYHVLQRRGWLDQSRREMQASWATFRALCASHIKVTVQELERLRPAGISSQKFLSRLTHHWYSWAFSNQPFWIQARVLDMYLTEGPKLLYRLGLSALKLFAAHAKQIGPSLEQSVMEFISTVPPEQQALWFRNAYNLPRLQSAAVMRQWSGFLTRIPPDAPLDQVDAAVDLLSAYSRKVVPDSSSEIFPDEGAWNSVWAWLPEWVTNETPECVFRASRDGYNLRTLFRKCENYSCIVLVVRTAANEVFGAFIASELRERHDAQFFGTGETFLFTLSPLTQQFSWTGETDLILRANDQELIVGSGGGAFGLWLDEDLDNGTTKQCQAFNNTPLTSDDTSFRCAAVEVYNCE